MVSRDVRTLGPANFNSYKVVVSGNSFKWYYHINSEKIPEIWYPDYIKGLNRNIKNLKYTLEIFLAIVENERRNTVHGKVN